MPLLQLAMHKMTRRVMRRCAYHWRVVYPLAEWTLCREAPLSVHARVVANASSQCNLGYSSSTYVRSCHFACTYCFSLATLLVIRCHSRGGRWGRARTDSCIVWCSGSGGRHTTNCTCTPPTRCTHWQHYPPPPPPPPPPALGTGVVVVWRQPTCTASQPCLICAYCITHQSVFSCLCRDGGGLCL